VRSTVQSGVASSAGRLVQLFGRRPRTASEQRTQPLSPDAAAQAALGVMTVRSLAPKADLGHHQIRLRPVAPAEPAATAAEGATTVVGPSDAHDFEWLDPEHPDVAKAIAKAIADKINEARLLARFNQQNVRSQHGQPRWEVDRFYLQDDAPEFTMSVDLGVDGDRGEGSRHQAHRRLRRQEHPARGRVHRSGAHLHFGLDCPKGAGTYARTCCSCFTHTDCRKQRPGLLSLVDDAEHYRVAARRHFQQPACCLGAADRTVAGQHQGPEDLKPVHQRHAHNYADVRDAFMSLGIRHQVKQTPEDADDDRMAIDLTANTTLNVTVSQTLLYTALSTALAWKKDLEARPSTARYGK